MPSRTPAIPSFQSGPVPRDLVPRRYTGAPTTIVNGYVYEWCPTHRYALYGMVPQHRLMMEVQIGRYLERKERVHHRNHIRNDNRLDNLELFAGHSEHMRKHWAGRGKNDPDLIERVRTAAADPTKNIGSLGMSPTTVWAICRKHKITWIPCGQRGRVRLLTTQVVREALRGRTTAQAAQFLGVNVMTLYNRFDRLLTKRARPGVLDQQCKEIVRLAWKERVPRAEIARRYGVSEVCVAKSIQRWSKQDAKSGGAGFPPLPRTRPGPKPRHKAPDTVASSPALAAAPQASLPFPPAE